MKCKLILLSLCFAVHLQAAADDAPVDLVNANYKVYVADINADGCPDYLLKPAGQIVTIPIDDDLMLVLPIVRNAQPLLVVSNSGCQTFSNRTPTPAELSDARWQAGNFAVAIGDSLGSTSGSLFVAPIGAAGSFAFNVSRSATGQLTLIQTVASAGLLTTPGARAFLENQNADNRTDLVIRDGNAVLAVFKANADGTFSPGPSDGVSVATAVWRGFIAALSGSDPSVSLSFVSPDIRSRVSAALATPGASPSRFAAAVVRFDVIDVETQWARCAVTINRGGVNTFFFVLIGVDTDGAWRIATL